VTTAWWNKLHEFSFCSVKLEVVGDHPVDDLFNATAELKTAMLHDSDGIGRVLLCRRRTDALTDPEDR